MPSPEIDLLFRRFQQTGDPRAIASFYDQVAPELLLLAAHLGHRTGDAEDLVQATFLAAIEAVDTWDATRRVMPWFVGILVNQARRERRRRTRRPDPLRLPAEETEDPRDVAEEHELTLLLSRHLHALPEHYRQVLTLRWVHGLTPLEIAHALGMPPDSVKTRLRRGRELLRRALPAGISAAGATLLAPRGLGAVREVVLQTAARRSAGTAGAGATAWSAAGGWSTMLGAAAVLAIAIVLATTSTTPSEIDLGAPIAAAGTNPPTSPTSGPNLEQRAVEVTRAAVDAPAEPSAALDLLVRFHDDTPVPFGVVRAVRPGAAEPLLSERLLHADASGRVSAESLAPGRWRLTPHRGGASVDVDLVSGRLTRTTLVIPLGVDLDGRVLDATGYPKAGVGVWISRAEHLDEGTVVTRTDADGRYHVRSVAVGRALGFLADAAVPVPLTRIDGPPGQRRTRDVDLAEVESGLVVRGRVVDSAGAPVEGARVQLGIRLAWLDFDAPLTSLAQRSPPVELVTGPDGRFERRGLIVYPDGVRMWARAPGGPLAIGKFPNDRTVTEIDLVVPPSVPLMGRVTDHAGTAIDRARIVLRDPRVPDIGAAPRWVESVAWSDADGRFLLPGAPLGTAYLTAEAPGGETVTATLDVTPGSTWDAVVRAPAPLEGRVVSAAGKPLEGLRVRALVSKGRLEPSPTTTDSWGRFRFDDLEPTPYDVSVTDPASAWSGAVATAAAAVPGRPVHLEVDARRLADASIRGRLVDEEGNPIGGRLFIGHLHPGFAYALADRNDGRFRIGPIPAFDGAYFLHAETDLGLVRIGGLALSPGEEIDVGDLVTRMPGALRLSIELEGAPPPFSYARIAQVDGTDMGPLRLNEGVSRRRALAPGSYRLHLTDPALAQTLTSFEIRSGEETELVLRPGPAAARSFEFRHEPAAPEVRFLLEWQDGDGRMICRDVMDGSGSDFVARQAFEAGNYRLRVRSHLGRTGTVSFEVAGPHDDAPPLVFELR